MVWWYFITDYNTTLEGCIRVTLGFKVQFSPKIKILWCGGLLLPIIIQPKGCIRVTIAKDSGLVRWCVVTLAKASGVVCDLVVCIITKY